VLIVFAVTRPGLAIAQHDSVDAVARAESAFADAMDATGIVSTIDSGLGATWAGKDRAAWTSVQQSALSQFRQRIAAVPDQGLQAADTRAVGIMRRKIGAIESDESGSKQPAQRCDDALRANLVYASLRASLYACFDQYGNAVEFEGQRLTRVTALGMLAEIDEPARRKTLFHAFQPLWLAVNGNDEADSPYRRVIRMAASDAAQSGSEIDAAARTLGVTSAQVESWLERVLDAWRIANDGPMIEPWDYRYAAGAAGRALRASVPRSAFMDINQRYYQDLGADLRTLGVLYDLDPRPGKAPLAYTDFVTRGRMIDGTWRPTVVRVSGNYANGGLGLLNELVHENGHAVHMMALHTRPAVMDLGDAVFYEAFADVPSWNTYEPAWQHKYLGRATDEAASLRALYSGVMLDVAWALFEARMLRNPQGDPNATWSAIASRYLHVVPHPELAWWAVRVQLVDSPGYMVNYGLGAVVTADLRQRIREQIGQFEAGNPRWYGWLTEHLLREGETLETRELLRRFLGRPVSADALLAQIARIRSTK
jgi:hypothetical protein